MIGKWFNWLYIDKNTLTQESEAQGWKCEIIYEDDQDQYLARLKLISYSDYFSVGERPDR